MTLKEAKELVIKLQGVVWSFGDPGRQAAYGELTKELAVLVVHYGVALEDLEAKGAGKDVAEVASIKRDLAGTEKKLWEKINALRGTINQKDTEIDRLKEKLKEAGLS